MRLSLLALLLGLLGCAHARFEALTPSTLTPTEKEEEAGAAVLLDELVVRYRPHPETGEAAAEVTSHLRTRYLKAGVGQPSHHVVHYPASFARVLSLRARVLDADGKERPVKEEERYDVAAVSAGVLYEDGRALVQPLPSVPEGGVLETEHVVLERNVRLFQQSFTFGGGHPTRLARLTVVVPEGWEPEAAFTQWGRPVQLAPTVRREGGEVVHTWEVRDAPEALEEPRGIWGHNLVKARVRLKRWMERGQVQEGFSGPEGVSAYSWELMRDASQPDATLQAAAREVLQKAGRSPREQAEALHAFVARQVRYCAVELGMGGWKPHAASQVLKLRAGDCKDKANLLGTLLALAGIPSRMGLLVSHGGHPVPYWLPTLAGNANHAILLVDLPEGTVAVDPTDPEVPFGELPARDQAAPLLPVEEKGGSLWTTPLAPPEANAFTLSLQARARPDGEARATFAAHAVGHPASGLRARLFGATPRGRREAIEGWLALRTPTLGEVEVRGVELPAKALEVEGEVGMGQLLTGRGRRRLLRPADVLPAPLPQLRDEERRTPYALYALTQHSLTLAVRLPEGVEVRLPEDVALTSPYGHYRLSWKQEGDSVHLTRECRLSRHVVPVEEYEAFRSFVEAALVADTRAAVVTLGAEASR